MFLQNPEEPVEGSWEAQKDARKEVHVSHAEIWIWFLKVWGSYQ